MCLSVQILRLSHISHTTTTWCSACVCLYVLKCVTAWLHCLALHGWIGLLVGSLNISEGERGRDSVQECRIERERKSVRKRGRETRERPS